MRRLLILCVLAALLGGCKKARVKKEGPEQSTASAQVQGNDGLRVHAPTGVVLGTGGGGGGGGAAQAVRQAARRTVTLHDMKNLQVFLDSYSGANGRMPTIEEIAAVLPKEAPQTDKLLREGVIRLTGIRTREGIWAYTFEPQTGSQHYVLTQSGIETMTPEDLRKRLEQQQGQ